jgi:uncharacterized protein (TIGR03663 family)
MKVDRLVSVSGDSPAAVSPRVRWSIFALLFLLALAVRLPHLDQRPMHTDEAVNAYITGDLLAGRAFQYDPHDRHGPALFAVALPVARALGARNFADLSETELRLTPVILGSLTVLLFGAAVELFGFIACLVAALLFAVGPLSVYYNRYFIHETLLVAATLGLMIAGWRAWRGNSLGWAAAAGLCAALQVTCKETAAIQLFALALALAVGWFLPLRERRPTAKVMAVAAGVFVLGVVLLFTWFGRNWHVFTDLTQAVPRFAARAGGEGHQKPFGYYFHLIDPMMVLFIVAAAGVYGAICDAVAHVRKPNVLVVIYGAIVFLIYSAIPYKTPWLALNIWLPLALACGLGVTAFWEQMKTAGARWFIGIAGAFLLAILGAQTKLLAFDLPADAKNPLAYAHTVDDLLRLPPRLQQLAAQAHLASPRIAVVAADPWPLPWYLRKFNSVGYWQPEQTPPAADFYLTTTDVPDALAARLKDFNSEYFGLRPDVLLVLWTPAATNADPAPVQP